MKPVLDNNALIPVLVCVVSMLNAMLETMFLFVSAVLDILVTHFHSAHLLQVSL